MAHPQKRYGTASQPTCVLKGHMRSKEKNYPKLLEVPFHRILTWITRKLPSVYQVNGATINRGSIAMLDGQIGIQHDSTPSL